MRTLTPLDALFLPASHVERLPDEDAAESAEDALWCAVCSYALSEETIEAGETECRSCDEEARCG